MQQLKTELTLELTEEKSMFSFTSIFSQCSSDDNDNDSGSLWAIFKSRVTTRAQVPAIRRRRKREVRAFSANIQTLNIRTVRAPKVQTVELTASSSNINEL
jgi:hypothetical protein